MVVCESVNGIVKKLDDYLTIYATCETLHKWIIHLYVDIKYMLSSIEY